MKYFNYIEKEKLEKNIHYEKHEKAWNAQNPGFSFFAGKGDVYGFENDHSAVPGPVYSGGAGLFVCPQPEKVTGERKLYGGA